MAFTFAVSELRTGRSMKFTGKKDSLNITWTREFQVIVSGTLGDVPVDVDPYSVVTAAGLPVVNRTIYTFDGKVIPFVICRDKSATQDPRNVARWTVKTSYKSADGNQDESANAPQTAPAALTDFTPSEEPILGEIEKVLYEDKSATPVGIKLPSGAYFAEPVMEKIPTLTIKLTQYETSITYQQMLDRKFKVNDAIYRTKAIYTWLITEVEAVEVDVLLAAGETSAYLVTYTLVHSPLSEGWKKALALIDYKHNTATPPAETFVPNLEGDPLTASLTFVDSDGVKKASQTVPDYVEYKPYDDTTFATFLQA